MTGPRFARVCGAIGALALLVPSSASAASTYTVTGTGDPNPTPACTGTVCPTLRAAVNAADADPGSTVQLGATTYDLSQSALIIAPATGSVTITGAGDGAGGTTIQQTHAGDRVVRVNGTQPVTLTGLILTGGTLQGTAGGAGAPGGDAFGGGIDNVSAPLTLDHVAVSDNTATGGDGGNGNAANPAGGAGGNAAAGIFSGGQLTLRGAEVTNNTAAAGKAGDGYSGAGGNGGFGGAAVGGIDEQAPTGPTSISGSAITGNKATGGGAGDKGGGPSVGFGGSADGGIDHTAQSLTIDSSVVSDNSATGGAGIAGATNSLGGNATGGLYATTMVPTPLTITGTTFANNAARGGNGGTGGFGLGGAMDILGMAGTLTGSTVTGNHATAGGSNGGQAPAIGGGGLFIDPGAELTVTNTTIAQNVASGAGNTSNHNGGSACGGGVSSEGTTTLVGDTIAGNTAQGGPRPAGGFGGAADGAGVCLYVSGTTVILNSTISGNVAQGGGTTTQGGFGGGGGVELQAGSAELANDTVAGNTVSPGGGGTAAGGNVLVINSALVGTMTFADTIISGGAGGTSANCDVTLTHVVDKGGNLESTTPSQCGLGTGDTVGADPKLGPLQDNGGPTQTMALGAGSPALGAGGACVDPTKSGSPPLTVDQRGQPRGGACDIGAFQSQKPANTAAPVVTGTAAKGKTLTCSQGTWSGDKPLTFAYQWTRGGNSIAGATSSTYTVGAADPSHSLGCTVTATNPYASAAATSAPVTIPPKPSITKLRQSHKRWHTSTTFSFTLNTAATVRLTFSRCTSRHHKLRCNHSAGSLRARKAHSGTNRIVFNGRLSKHKKLKPAAYAVTVTASNSSGKTTSKPLHFTIV
jgi:hypothetical protein